MRAGDDWNSSYSNFPARAMPLMEVEEGSEANGWVVSTNSEACELLSRIEECVIQRSLQQDDLIVQACLRGGRGRPVSNRFAVMKAVTVCETSRAGKSSLLNWLCTGKQESSQHGFGVGHEVQRCTRGIWMWGRPLATRCEDGGRAAVILLDTEGLGGLGDVDDAYDATVFTLALLLASTLVYNSLGTLDERAIGSLGFCTQLSRRLSVRRGEEEEERETRQALKRTMPRLVWVLRDFALELVDESGETVSSDAYLERSLRPNGRRESDDTRAAIAAYFPNRSCWCLPRPFATEEAATSGVARPRDEFWQEFESFRDSVLYGDNCVVKSIEGTVVRGSTLAALAVEYAKAFQQTRPKITSAWRAAVDIQLSTAIQRGVASHAASLRERDGDLATRHARGCRLAEDAVREAVLGGGSVSLCAAVETAIAELRRECDAALGEYRDGSRKRRETVLKAQLATLEGEVLAPALEQTRAIFALADDPRLEGAYDSLDDAELRLTRLISRVVSPRERVDVDDDEAFSLAQHAVRFTVAASFEAARAVSDTAHDRREAALALCEQQKRDLESRIGFLEGQDKALRESVDEQRKKQHFELTEALAQKTRVQTLEAAVRAERSRAADLVAQVESSRAELADAAAALDNEERWQRELQERLDMRIKMSQEREEDLARRLERAQRRRKYTVLDFLLDDPDDVAEKFNIDSDKLEKFLADINLPNILPALKHLGASRVSDLMYLEPDDLDELVDIDIVQKRRLMKAVDAAKAEYSASANAGRCSLS